MQYMLCYSSRQQRFYILEAESDSFLHRDGNLHEFTCLEKFATEAVKVNRRTYPGYYKRESLARKWFAKLRPGEKLELDKPLRI
jgi:hypothetical protein